MKTLYAFLGGAAAAGALAFLIWSRQPEPQAPQAVAAVRPEPAPYVAPAPPAEPESAAVPEIPAPKPKPARARKPVPAPVPVAPPPAEPAPAAPVETAKNNPLPVQEAPPSPPAQSEPEHPQLMKPDAVEIKRAREERTPQTVTIPAGTVLHVRVNQNLSSEHNENGDTFSTTLDEPLVANGFVIAERGSRLDGRVVDSQRAGKVKGLAKLSVRLVQLHTSDEQKVSILTDDFLREGQASRGSDAAKVGIGAGVGAALGAIFGGGKGAAIGAATGGAAGGGAVLMTRGKAAEIGVETKIPFRLRDDVTITENLH